MSERKRDPGDGSNRRMFPANKKPRRTPVNTNLSLPPSSRAEDGPGGAEEENTAAAQQGTGGGVESRTLDLISSINRPAGTSSADHAGPRTLDLISEIDRTNDQAGGGDGQGRGSVPPPPPQGGNALAYARSAPNAMGPGIFSATAARVWSSNSHRAVQQASNRNGTNPCTLFPFLRDARSSMLSQRPQRQGDGECGPAGRTAEKHPASLGVPYPVGRDSGLACTGVPQVTQQQHLPRRTQHELRAEGGGVGDCHIGSWTGRPDELALRGGMAPDVVPPRPSQQPSDALGGLSKSCYGHPSGHPGKVPALASSGSIGQQALEGTGGDLTQACDVKGSGRGWLKAEDEESDIIRANRAIHRAIGKYVPAIRLHQLLQPPAEAQPPRLTSSVQPPIHDALQLNQDAVQPGGSTVQEINDAAGPCVCQVVPEAINSAAAGQLVPVLAATAASDPLPQPEPEPQPNGTCPRCRTGCGTVSLHHLCQCRQCPDLDRLCPFCALVAVPMLERPVKTEEGSCPFCRPWPGVAKAGHLCLCWLCQEIPEAGCRYCTLKDLPLPEPQLYGKCPCCTENQGRVAIQHLCLCEGCKELPDALCPFCLLAKGCVPTLAFSVMVLYNLTMWY